jgi:hypothetical protein
MDFTELREAIEEMEVVDAHAHNIVALDSTVPFISGFSEANGDALTFAPHSLSFKVLTLRGLFSSGFLQSENWVWLTFATQLFINQSNSICMEFISVLQINPVCHICVEFIFTHFNMSLFQGIVLS